MGIEIERKYLIANDEWRELTSKSTEFNQFYLTVDPHRTVRVRIYNNKKAKLTVKGKAVHGYIRKEFEYSIPVEDARELAEMSVARVDKTRFIVYNGTDRWEVDEFHGRNEGLVLAEFEFDPEGYDMDQNNFLAPDKPNWVGADVTNIRKYASSQLAIRPYQDW